MIKDFYHTNAFNVSAMLRSIAYFVLAIMAIWILLDPLVAFANEAPSSEALTLKATTGASKTTDFVKTLAKPLGTVVFVVLALVMMVLGKQILAKFGWVIIGLILVVMGGSLVTVIYSFFA